MAQKIKIAVMQHSPVLFDRERSAEKAVRLIHEAGEAGASLVVFPESFIPCYPRGLSFGMHIGGADSGGRRDYLRYYDNAVSIPSPTLDALCEAAQSAGCFVSIGITERDSTSGTLYCTNVFISADGRYLGKHRKLKPTGAERCIWGEGGAEDVAVFDTPVGRVGSLICWENYMPLARVALYQQGIDIYIAPTADSRREWQATVRHIAQEGRCFVISCNQFVTADMYPPDLCSDTGIKTRSGEISSGGSCVIDPSGKYLAGPVWHKEEMLLCELDMSRIAAARLDFDPCGHYSRPDLFELRVTAQNKK